ncbi:hypothetical protein ABK040_014635 [Willaertia magna]
MLQQNNNNSPSTSSSPLTTQSSSSFNKDEVEKQIEEWKNKLKTFICPISQQLMIDPVIISETGQTYDRKTIEEWLQKQNTCPSTGIKLKSKTLTPNYIAKSAINENVEKFIKKVIKNVKLWTNNVNLFEICVEIINESLDLIKNNNSFKNYQKELYELKFNILLNEKNEDKLFDNYIKLINELNDINFKILQLQKLENKLTKDTKLEKFYEELLKLLIAHKKNDNLLKEMFTKYCKLSYFYDYFLINSILNYLNNDDIKLEYLIILFNNEYRINDVLEKLIKIKISNKMKQEFISFFRNLMKKIDFNKFETEFLQYPIIYKKISNLTLKSLIDFIKDYKELNKEKVIIYKELYNNTNDIKYLEIIYELNENDKEIENQLLNEYLKLNSIDKYLNLYIKVNENKLDSNNIVLFKLLQIQNNEINNLKQINVNQNQKIDILQQIINNTNSFVNNLLENKNLNNEIQEWKNQQIINNFKIKYPDYDYVNIINIETPLNVKKEEYFFSDEFEVFGLKWKIKIYPKGNSKSKEAECSIYLHLNSLQYKNENEEEKEISSIKIKCLIDNTNLNDNRNYESIFTKIEGRGYSTFKQSNFIPIIKNDKQIFSVVIGMKKLDIEFE